MTQKLKHTPVSRVVPISFSLRFTAKCTQGGVVVPPLVQRWGVGTFVAAVDRIKPEQQWFGSFKEARV